MNTKYSMVAQTELNLSAKTGPGRGLSIKNRRGVFFVGLVLFSFGIITYYNDSLGTLEVILNARNKVIRQYPACPIPQLEPFHESIQDLVDDKTLPSVFNCTASHPILFNSTLRSTIVPAKGPDYFREEGYESCCYREVAKWTGGVEPQDKYQFVSPECIPLNLTSETTISDGHEFIGIYCRRRGRPKETLEDVHTFVPLKQRRSSGGGNTTGTGEKLNLVIFGLDAMSRMNFLRTMPSSYSFLKNEMEAVEMFGYNKVGDNTAPNIFPLLMSEKPGELHCANRGYLDDCPFIWKEYSKAGYFTMYSEDTASVSIFTNRGYHGFRRQPTDYYPRPLFKISDSKYNKCYGPRLTFQYLLDHMEKYVETMNRNNKNFFHFTWSAGLTHDQMNAAELGDPHLLKSLRWMKESGHLKNTIFILMSDHGARMDTIRNRIQGQLEDRLPFMYFVLPNSFKTKYKRAYRNLLSNADKLITTFDLHESLKDVVNLGVIGERELLKREGGLSRLGRNLTRGISLFLPIPEFRTCEMAGIQIVFCSCIHSNSSHVELVDVSNPEVNAVARMAVSHINAILGVSASHPNSKCALLHLDKVNMAWRASVVVNKWEGYTINFETKPGGATFEAMVQKDIEERTWIVQTPIVRTNRYGNQSHCVQNVKLKSYCYCRG